MNFHDVYLSGKITPHEQLHFFKAGAIPLCVTNVSELGSWWESSNPVYGTTKNPYDILRTPGGSSGGEAALQAAAGIPLSLGMN